MQEPLTTTRRKVWVRRKVRAIIIILGAAASLTAILGFPYQVGLLHPGKPKERSSPNNSPSQSNTSPASPQEIDAWNQALANRADCDSVRQYILEYPAGHFVTGAQAILGARREIAEERWMAFEFPSTVVASSSLESRASRDMACASAREQMITNMSDGCAVFRSQPSRYRSITVAPPDSANCECQDEAIYLDNQMTNPLWRCSIRATYSCRGEQSQQVKRFVCN